MASSPSKNGPSRGEARLPADIPAGDLTAPCTVTAVLEAAPAMAALVDATGVILRTNTAWRDEAVGAAPALRPLWQPGGRYPELLRATTADLPRAESEALVAGVLGVLTRATRHFTAEILLTPGGVPHWYAVSVRPLGEERDAGAIVWHEDVSRRRSAEEMSRRAERRGRMILEAALDAVVIANSEGVITGWTGNAEAVFGWSADEAVGRRFTEMIIPERLREAHERGFARFLATRVARVAGRQIELTALRRDGVEIPIELSLSAITEGDDVGFVAFVRDVSVRRDALAALASSEERLRGLVAVSPLGIAGVDEDNRFVEVNPAMEEITGRSRAELLTLGPADITPPRYWALDERERSHMMSTGRLGPYEKVYERPDGTHVHVRINGVVVLGSNGAVNNWAIVEDVTDVQRAEAERQQAQKLESIGQLAAGIAHEINTPVQFASDSVRFLKDTDHEVTGWADGLRGFVERSAGGHADAEEARQLLDAEDDLDLAWLVENRAAAIDRAIDGLERVAAIVRSMRDYAHPDGREMVAVNLNARIASTLTVARNEYKYVADLETDLGDLPPVVCHAGQICQAVLNVVVNAAHAIADASGPGGERGVIRVATTLEGDDAVITVSDTGGGVPVEVRHRVFDPFFTTKEVGRGTGQGLPIARGAVVDVHGGSMTFEVEEGVGTTFRMAIPVDGRLDDR